MRFATGDVDRHVIDEVIDGSKWRLAIAEPASEAREMYSNTREQERMQFFVGEALMRSDNPGRILAEQSAGHHPSLLADRRMRIREAHRGSDGSWRILDE